MNGFVYHGVLLLIAAIWGSGFMAQQAGLLHLQPFSFNVGRFALAVVFLLPIWWWMNRTRRDGGSECRSKWLFWAGGFLAGSVMFAGFGFQQAGLQFTTTSKAGFITSMYIVMVPLLGAFGGQRTQWLTWLGIGFAVVGLYFLSMKGEVKVNRGDVLELMGAIFWALHVLTLDALAKRLQDLVALSLWQFCVALGWALLFMWGLEQPSWENFEAALLPLVYSGMIVSGLAFTLQVIAQRHVNASTTALILSAEAVFALLAGQLILDESISITALGGCALMLVGILLSQWAEHSAMQLKTDTTV